MNGQNDLGSIQNPKSYQTAILAVIATALIVGVGVYAWQRSQLRSTEARLQEQIASLQNQIALSNKETAKQEDNPEIQKENVTEQKPSDVQDGQKEQGGFTKLKEEHGYIHYSGTATISGIYDEIIDNDTPSSNVICFSPDASSQKIIPREDGDTRTVSFCFENQDEAKAAFGINDDDLSSKNIECIEGKATIKISNYGITKIEGATWDVATLEQIISKEAYKTSCSN